MSFGGVSGSSLIPATLFILPVTLIPSVSDGETQLIPLWRCTRVPSCQIPSLWPCLGCY